MPRATRDAARRALPRAALIFAALGDDTRLELLKRLSGGSSRSIAQLAEGAAISRQAITKHLRVLRNAGLVRSAREGRETRFELEPEALRAARRRLEEVSLLWDDAIARLKAHVEE